MKNFVKNMLVAAIAVLAVTGCDRQNGGGGSANEVSPAVLEAFAERFPGAENVRWSVKGEYAVANFYWEGTRASSVAANCSAWFENSGGAWSMTETEILFDALPQAVKDAFAASEYASWSVNREVDVLYRSGEVEPEIYVIEVKQAGREMDLYYSPDGVLVKTVADSGPDYDYGDFIPSQPSAGIEEYIRTHYPSARIIDVDSEYEGTEVEIVDGGVKRELFFDRNGAWQYTKTEIRRSELPATVVAAWEASEYAEANGYSLDDVDLFETAADGTFYRLELESRNGDVKLKITPEGELSLYEPVGDGSVPTDVDAFIRDNYPGATVLERDFDDGYLEVDIMHDGRRKEVLFNGSGAWVRTSLEIRYNELPAAVLETIRNSEYASWEFDGADYVQTPDGEWYEIELEDERADREVTLRISADGSIR